MIISPKLPQIIKPNKSNKSLIVTGGGLCPGINLVVNQLVYNLRQNKKDVYGSKNSFNGIAQNKIIHSDLFDYSNQGSCLGMSRNKHSSTLIAESLIKNDISELYVIGGDGSLSIAHKVSNLVENTTRVIGIPKTIDNDIVGIDHSFGFYSAVDACNSIIDYAYIEAKNYNAVSLFKCMGRNSGFLSAYAAGSSTKVDLCIIPESLDSISNYIKKIDEIYANNGFCVIILSEGCGEIFCENLTNYISVKYKIKYFDPGYIVRNAKLNSYDSIYCKQLAYNATKLAKMKYTNCAIGKSNHIFCAIPLKSIANKQKKISSHDTILQYINT